MKALKNIRGGKKPLGLFELISVAVGGMIGGGIFAILGVSVEKIGNATPVAILIGGGLAMLAAYSYVKLALYYQDEGATYSFFKKTFPRSHFAASAIGWYVIFGYTSTLALYAFTFASYFRSVWPHPLESPYHKLIAGAVILLFVLINIFSVRDMGKLEDLMVYLKISILSVLSIFFIWKGHGNIHAFQLLSGHPKIGSVLIVMSLTFVAFEGFQLAIHAFSEAESPLKNIPRAIYISVGMTAILYTVLAWGALLTIPNELMVRDKEFALASGATLILGKFGLALVVLGALLATSSAINGTLFGASRLMAVIAGDGYFPKPFFRRSRGHIPHYSILAMGLFAYLFILTGGLETILEFGSLTFIIVSFLMAVANFKIRKKNQSRGFLAVLSMVGLFCGGVILIFYEISVDPRQVAYILAIYGLLTFLSWLYSRFEKWRQAVT